MKQKGFTLIEMIIVILVLGILMPVVIMPIISGSKNMSNPVESAGLGAVARSHMEIELATIDTWPFCPLATVCVPPYWPATDVINYTPAPQSFTDTLNGRTYTTTITERFCDATNPLAAPPCTNTTAIVAPALVSTANNYLVITVTTTSTGGTVNYETIKTRAY